MTTASLILEKIKITKHPRQRLAQRSTLSQQEIQTLVNRIYAAVLPQPDGRYFVYSNSLQHGILINKKNRGVEYITAYQKGMRTARDSIPLMVEDMKHHTPNAVQTTLERFDALYTDDNTLVDFYCPTIGRALFLLEVK